MIKAVFFDIGGTVHTQDATPESDRDYKERLWRYLEEHGIRTADTPDELLEHINKGAKAYKAYRYRPTGSGRSSSWPTSTSPQKSSPDSAKTFATCSTAGASTS